MAEKRIGNLVLGDRPRLAVPLYDDDPAADVAAIRGLADLIEARIDCFADLTPAHVQRVLQQLRAAGLPIIATVRWAEEGGQGALADEDRLALYEAALPFCDAVDVELRAPIRDRVVAAGRAAGRMTIVSHHDFHGLPGFDVLEGTIDEADAAGADIVKVAATARTTAEIRTLLEFTLRHRDRGLVTMALGEAGLISRVFFPLAGSLWTFGYHRAPSGPGQLPLVELRAELARFYPE